jgi:hypothetical protein
MLMRLSEYLWPRKYEEILAENPPSVTMETVIIFLILLTAGTSACAVVFLIEVIIIIFRRRSDNVAQRPVA